MKRNIVKIFGATLAALTITSPVFAYDYVTFDLALDVIEIKIGDKKSVIEYDCSKKSNEFVKRAAYNVEGVNIDVTKLYVDSLSDNKHIMTREIICTNYVSKELAEIFNENGKEYIEGSLEVTCSDNKAKITNSYFNGMGFVETDISNFKGIEGFKYSEVCPSEPTTVTFYF